MAKEVERIGASPIFAAATFTKEQTVERETARKRFHQLPGTMKLCAMVLDAFIQRVPELTRESFSRPERRQSTFLAYLSYVVKAATGKLLDRQVAELLDAAAAAFGVKREFYAMTIAQARSRFKKKPKT